MVACSSSSSRSSSSRGRYSPWTTDWLDQGVLCAQMGLPRGRGDEEEEVVVGDLSAREADWIYPRPARAKAWLTDWLAGWLADWLTKYWLTAGWQRHRPSAAHEGGGSRQAVSWRERGGVGERGVSTTNFLRPRTTPPLPLVQGSAGLVS